MRVPLILACSVLLAACGFQPRAQLSLPATLGPVKVETSDPYSPLGLELAAALERAGAAGATAGTASSSLKITEERLHQVEGFFDRHGGKVIVIDPWVTSNPKTPAQYKTLESLGKVDLVLVTHGHFDHVGGLHYLLEQWPDVPVYAHPLELPYLTGLSSYPPPDPPGPSPGPTRWSVGERRRIKPDTAALPANRCIISIIPHLPVSIAG